MNLENNIIWLEETDSTNKFIKTLVDNNAIKNGTIISAKKQTDGRGQLSNIWLSEPNKNLTFSIYLKTNIKATHQFYISKIIALSIYEFINSITNDVKIKWPNDIYIKNKKVAGILIENTIQGEYITKTIIGIGVNINQTEFDKLLPNPISLKNITNKNYNLKDILAEIDAIIKTKIKLLNNFKTIDKEYNSKLYLLNNKAYFTDNNSIQFTGTIIGTELDGRIKIKTQNLVKRFGFHEIKYIL